MLVRPVAVAVPSGRILIPCVLHKQQVLRCQPSVPSGSTTSCVPPAREQRMFSQRSFQREVDQMMRNSTRRPSQRIQHLCAGEGCCTIRPVESTTSRRAYKTMRLISAGVDGLRLRERPSLKRALASCQWRCSLDRESSSKYDTAGRIRQRHRKQFVAASLTAPADTSETPHPERPARTAACNRARRAAEMA